MATNFSSRRRKSRGFVISYCLYTLSTIAITPRAIAIMYTMSTHQASRTLLRRAFQTSQRALREREASRFVANNNNNNNRRSIHYIRTVSAMTPSDSRRRPTLRPSSQPLGIPKINEPSAGNRRSIFIQTESTPNPDVREITTTITGRILTDRLSNSFPTNPSCRKTSPRRFSSTCRHGRLWRRHTRRR